METRWTRDANKEFQALPKAKREAVLKAIAGYAANPFASNPNAKPLKGVDRAVRLRVGDYRVVLVRGNGVIDVVTVAHRKEVYR